MLLFILQFYNHIYDTWCQLNYTITNYIVIKYNTCISIDKIDKPLINSNLSNKSNNECCIKEKDDESFKKMNNWNFKESNEDKKDTVILKSNENREKCMPNEI